jgi:hypothetical protein
LSSRTKRSEVKDLHLFFASQPVRSAFGYHAAMHQGSYFTYVMASRSRTLPAEARI